MTPHDSVYRELFILASDHARLGRTYTALACELRKQHKCGTVRFVEEGVSRAITEKENGPEALAEILGRIEELDNVDGTYS